MSHPLPKRRNPRLPGFDYAAGWFFVTMVTAKRRCLFGEIRNGRMYRNELGALVTEEWLRTGLMRPNVELDALQVMPNHLHALIGLFELPNRDPSHLARIIGGFKSLATSRIREVVGGNPEVWQRNYHEQLVRSERALEAVREYITGNPGRWADDPENPV